MDSFGKTIRNYPKPKTAIRSYLRLSEPAGFLRILGFLPHPGYTIDSPGAIPAIQSLWIAARNYPELSKAIRSYPKLSGTIQSLWIAAKNYPELSKAIRNYPKSMDSYGKTIQDSQELSGTIQSYPELSKAIQSYLRLSDGPKPNRFLRFLGSVSSLFLTKQARPGLSYT